MIGTRGVIGTKMPDNEPRRIFGVSDVAAAWGISSERVRQLISTGVVVPELVCMVRKDYVASFWYEIPERRNGLATLIRRFIAEDTSD